MRGLRLSKRALSFESIFGHDLSENQGYGKKVTVERSRSSMAVWACQSLISGDLANLPFSPFVKNGDTREPLDPEPSWIDQPNPLNPNFTEISYKRQVGLSLLQNGNAFIACYPDVFDPVRLLVLDPLKVEIRDGDSMPAYDITGTGIVLSPLNLVHIPFILPPGGARGLNPIEAASLGISIDLAAQTQNNKFFDGGGLITGVIEVPREAGDLAEIQLDQLRSSFRRKKEGPAGYSIGVLQGGATFKPITMNHKDAQYIEARKYQLEEIARLYLIPPFMVGSQEASGVAYASSVEREQHYIEHCLVHYAGPIEAGHRRLLPGPNTYMKFNFNALLRGSPKERAEFYDSGLQNKWLFLEDVARWEELDPKRTGTYLETPNNNGPKPTPAPKPPAPPPARSDTIINNHPPVFPEGFVRSETNVTSPVNVTTPEVVAHIDARTVVAEGAITAPNVTVEASPTPEVNVTVAAPVQRSVRRVIEHDALGKPVAIVETPVDGE